MSGPLYPARERKISSIGLESKRYLETAERQKQELEASNRSMASEGLLLLNPSEELKKKQLEIENTKRQVAADALLLLGQPETVKPSKGVPYKPSTHNLDVVTAKMSDLINQLYGRKIVDEWKVSAKRPRRGRDIYEVDDATTQCMNTIRGPEEAPGCWICGFAFDRNIESMRPNCDHILPVAQAVFFLGLYSTRKVTPTEIQKLNDTIYHLEYAWAHSACNIQKSNMIFINETEDPVLKTPQWTVNTTSIEELLQKIEKGTAAGLLPIQKQIVDSTKWHTSRLKSITDKVKKITDFISRPEEPGLGNLTVLAGWASLVDPTSMTDDFLDFIDVKLPPNVLATSRRKRSMSPSSDTDPPAKRMRMGATRRRKIRKSRKTYKWRRSF